MTTEAVRLKFDLKGFLVKHRLKRWGSRELQRFFYIYKSLIKPSRM